jgi:hypothetical protein
MNPALLALIVQLVEEAIKVYPALSADLREIFSKQNPTPEDWLILREKVLAERFETLAPHAAANLPEN